MAKSFGRRFFSLEASVNINFVKTSGLADRWGRPERINKNSPYEDTKVVWKQLPI